MNHNVVEDGGKGRKVVRSDCKMEQCLFAEEVLGSKFLETIDILCGETNLVKIKMKGDS